MPPHEQIEHAEHLEYRRRKRPTLLVRAVFDIRAALADPRQRQYLSNLEFLKAVAIQRDTVSNKATIIGLITAVASLYVLFISPESPVDLELFGVKL
jgi:hypothetical protein